MNDERKKWVIETFHLIFPIVLGVSVVSFVGYVFVNDMQGKYWSFISAYFFPPLGKETIIPAGILIGIHPLVMALSIAFVDFIVALFLIWNYDLAKNIPLIGTFMKKVESIGETSSNKYSWIKPLRFIGIMLFVMIPFQGSGGMVGSIVGRLIGMKPWTTLISITLGAVIGCTIVAYFAESLKIILLQNLNVGLIIITILFIVGIFIYLFIKNNKNKKQESI